MKKLSKICCCDQTGGWKLCWSRLPSYSEK